MNRTKVARRSDSLYYGNDSRRALCNRTASLEELVSVMPYCWNGWCECGCPMYDTTRRDCLAGGLMSGLGIRTDVEPD